MNLYKTQSGYVMVNDDHKSHFEKNYEFDRSWIINQPSMGCLKAKKPYDSVPEEDLINYIEELITLYNNRIKSFKHLLKEVKQ